MKDTSPRIDTDAGPIFACCQGCAEYFANNRERVLTARKLEVVPHS